MLPLRKIEVWVLSLAAGLKVYRLTRKFPADERFGLTAQLRRAAVSITANIAEGSRRASDRDYAHFVNISEGSTAEVETLLEYVLGLEIAGKAEVEPIAAEYVRIAKMLYALRLTLRS
jgi:four helix bundle protein